MINEACLNFFSGVSIMFQDEMIIDENDVILVTGASGFIGSRVVKNLLDKGFTNLRCLIRNPNSIKKLENDINPELKENIQFIVGNLLSRGDCEKAARGVSVVLHLAAGRGEKSFAEAFLNSVITTRNLLDALVKQKSLKRFLCVSSFSVYSTRKMRRGNLLDESCEVDAQPHLRGEAYGYAKNKQEEIVKQYGDLYNMPYTIVRPGVVYGPGNKGLTGRVGIDTFGVFLHLGGSNKIPLTYVDNCAEAIVLAGLKKGINNKEIFNIVDDELPTSRKFLKMYKKNVGHFKSIYVPHILSWLLCFLWEKYSKFSKEQMPPAFNRNLWSSYWKGNKYTNQKLKQLLGWEPKIPFCEAVKHYFDYQRKVKEA